MRKLRVYLDTSVISYLDQRDAPEKMQETRQLWDMFRQGTYEAYLSDTTMQEINKCNPEKRATLTGFLAQIPYTLIVSNDEIHRLANKFLEMGILRPKSYDDCLHIAAAIVSDCDMITSWNFKYIVNAKTMRGVRVITTLERYGDVSIYAPPSLLDYEEDNDESD